MRSLVLSVGGLLIGITFMATDVAAWSGQVTGGSISCNAPGFRVTWAGTWDPPGYGYDVVGCWAADYWYQSPETHFSPDGSATGPGTSSSGSETVEHVPQYQEGYELQGVLVWFEWGSWDWSSQFQTYYWHCRAATDWYYLVRVGSCFAPGTPLLTPEGSKPIERFRAGDWILSSPENEPESPVVARRVKEVIRSSARLVDVAVSGQVVHASREHPFYVKGKGWTPAASLARGDLLRSHDDRWLPVESIVNVGRSAVYNVRVEEHATYFVGRRDWGFSPWVYGACNRPKTPREQFARSEPVRSAFPDEAPR